MSASTVKCSVTIDRSHPKSKDPSVSGWGHETGPRFWSTDTDRTTVNAWIKENAPEINLSQTRRPVFTLGESIEFGGNVQGIESRDFYFLTGIDSRGYHTSVYVQFYYPETVKVVNAGTFTNTIDGTSVYVDRMIVTY